jgi:hypothetical protein
MAIAGIIGTGIIIITSYMIIFTTGLRVTFFSGTFIVIIAVRVFFWFVYTSALAITRIISTNIVVITDNIRILASGFRSTIIIRTCIVIIAFYFWVLTSILSIAGIFSTFVIIITIDFLVRTSSFRRTVIISTNVVIIAAYLHVHIQPEVTTVCGTFVFVIGANVGVFTTTFRRHSSS